MSDVNQTPECEERGATSVEYALMAGLIACTIAVTVGFFGASINDLFELIPPEIWP